MEFSATYIHNDTSLLCTGLNRDCSVIFVNGDENGIQSINGDLFLEFIPIGPVEITECRFELEPRPVGQPFGDFVPCKYHVDQLRSEYM